MKRILRLSIEIEVSDLSQEERRECAHVAGCPLSEIPRIKDNDADDFGHIIAEAIPCLTTEFFEGTDTYASFDGAVLGKAEWIERKGSLVAERARRIAARRRSRKSPVGNADAPKENEHG